MIIEKNITVNKSIAACWQVLGVEFAEASTWATAINHSVGSGENYNGASCSERGCDVQGMGSIKEKILDFSNETTSLKYQIVEGMPAMIKYATNSWNLTPKNDNQSVLQMRMNIKIGGLIGKLMQPMMKIQMSKMGSGLMEDFKYYVENGTPSPSKIKALKKRKA